MVKQGVYQSGLTLTCTGRNGKARRFVDNDEIVVLKENIDWNRFRPCVDLLWRRLDENNLVIASNNLPRPCGRAIELNERCADQPLESRAGIIRQSLCQKLIKTQVRVVSGHDKLDRRRMFQGFA